MGCRKAASSYTPDTKGWGLRMAVSTGGVFPSTQWSLIAQLQSDEETARRAASKLAERCWPPVYAYRMRWGMSRDEAADTTQSFFLDVVMGRGIFERARPEVGRLRSLMRTSLRNYLTDLNRKSKRRHQETIVRLEESEHEEHIQGTLRGLDPDAAFDKRWALALFQEAMARCEKHFRRPVLERNWAAFEAWIVQPATSRTDPDIERLCQLIGFRP